MLFICNLKTPEARFAFSVLSPGFHSFAELSDRVRSRNFEKKKQQKKTTTTKKTKKKKKKKKKTNKKKKIKKNKNKKKKPEALFLSIKIRILSSGRERQNEGDRYLLLIPDANFHAVLVVRCCLMYRDNRYVIIHTIVAVFKNNPDFFFFFFFFFITLGDRIFVSNNSRVERRTAVTQTYF